MCVSPRRRALDTALAMGLEDIIFLGCARELRWIERQNRLDEVDMAYQHAYSTLAVNLSAPCNIPWWFDCTVRRRWNISRLAAL